MTGAQMWAVAAGEYSDYRVLCVCPTERDAEQLAVRIRGQAHYYHNDARVEELPLCAADLMPTPVLALSVTVWDDGTVDGLSERTTDQWPWDYGFAPSVSWRWVRAPMHKNKGGRLDVSGSDFERVRRVFSDKRAQLLAEDAFRMRREATGQR